MSSSKRSIIARILGWFGLLSGLQRRKSEAPMLPIVPPFARSPTPEVPPVASSPASRETPQPKQRRNLLAARLASVARLNQPVARASLHGHLSAAAKPIAKSVRTRPLRSGTPVRSLRKHATPKRPMNNVIAFRPRALIAFQRAA